MKTQEQLQKELDSPIPRDCVEERDGGGGRKLSFLPGWYIIDRLNKVFGQGNWQYAAEDPKLVHSGVIQDRYGKDVHTVHYTAKVRLEVKFPKVPKTELKEDRDHYYSYANWTSFEDVGYGDGSDKMNPGKAHELAVKEAVTDALKRCAKSLGMSMGLALYDKTQEHVVDEPVVEKKVAAADTTVGSNRDRAIEEIRKSQRVLEAKRILTKDQLKEKIKAYGADKLDALNDAQVSELLTDVRNLLK